MEEPRPGSRQILSCPETGDLKSICRHGFRNSKVNYLAEIKNLRGRLNHQELLEMLVGRTRSVFHPPTRTGRQWRTAPRHWPGPLVAFHSYTSLLTQTPTSPTHLALYGFVKTCANNRCVFTHRNPKTDRPTARNVFFPPSVPLRTSRTPRHGAYLL